MKLPKITKISSAMQLSMLAMVILLGAVFVTVNSALQEQQSAGHASTSTGITLVQSVLQKGNTNKNTVVFNQAVTKGHLIVVAVGNLVGNISVSDNQGDTFKPAVIKPSDGVKGQVGIFYVENAHGGSTFIYTDSTDTSGLTGVTVAAYEYAGVATTDALDQVSSQSGYNTSLTSANTTVTDTDNELVFGAASYNTNATSLSVSAGSGYTMRQKSLVLDATDDLDQPASDDDDYASIVAEDNIVQAKGAYAATFTANKTLNWKTAVATFRAAPTSVASGLSVVAPACVTPEYAGSGVHVLWSESAVTFIDISTDSSFGTYYNKAVSGTTSTTGPSGFVIHGGTTALTLNPNTTYYVRTWDGTLHSPLVSFSIPQCQPTPTPAPTDNPTPSCGPPPSCLRNGVNVCLMPVGGWCGFPTPTPETTQTPTVSPTTIPVPTDTPAPGQTVINFTINLHGIGTGGDSANPNSVGNTNPLRPGRNLTVTIYDVQNQLVATEQGVVHYDHNSGKFTGSVNLGPAFTTGLYTVKVKTDQYLRAIIPGIQTITSGQTTTLPAATLVAGDINGDNAINIVDYNILIGCYSDLLPATDCSASNNVLADLSDDGHVNQFDYNLFLRELTNIGGQ